MALEKLDQDEKLISKLLISGQCRDVWTLNEPGLWKLIFRSNKPEAKRLQKWVTSEVLPSIRKTGSFHVEPERKFGMKETNQIFKMMQEPEEEPLDLKTALKILLELKKSLGPKAAMARFDKMIGYKRTRSPS